MARPFSRRAGRQRTRGQALVEVALVLPVFMLMFMTLVDFGRVIYAQNTINQDAREGVRKGIVSTSDLKTNALFTARFADIRAAARVMSPGVPITDASIFGDPVVACPSPLPSDLTVSGTCFYPNGVTSTTATVVVRIHVRVDFITPIISNILGGGIDIWARAEQLVQS
jgi:Flp pilus assembly protein TadG